MGTPAATSVPTHVEKEVVEVDVVEVVEIVDVVDTTNEENSWGAPVLNTKTVCYVLVAAASMLAILVLVIVVCGRRHRGAQDVTIPVEVDVEEGLEVPPPMYVPMQPEPDEKLEKVEVSSFDGEVMASQ